MERVVGNLPSVVLGEFSVGAEYSESEFRGIYRVSPAAFVVPSLFPLGIFCRRQRVL